MWFMVSEEGGPLMGDTALCSFWWVFFVFGSQAYVARSKGDSFSWKHIPFLVITLKGLCDRGLFMLRIDRLYEL